MQETLYSFCSAIKNGTVAQSVEQRTFNPLVASSNLARPTISDRFIQVTCLTPFQALLKSNQFARAVVIPSQTINWRPTP